MRVRYIGQSIEGVDVPLDTPQGPQLLHCPQGGEIDVPDEVGRSLLEQTEKWAAGTRGKAPAGVSNDGD